MQKEKKKKKFSLFQNDYSGKIRMIHLNRGYRSSQNIVSLCSKVIQQGV